MGLVGRAINEHMGTVRVVTMIALVFCAIGALAAQNILVAVPAVLIAGYIGSKIESGDEEGFIALLGLIGMAGAAIVLLQAGFQVLQSFF